MDERVTVPRLLVAAAARLMPPQRSAWRQAMLVEAAHIEGPDAVLFALGCLQTAVFERMRSMNRLIALGRWTTVAATLCVAVGMAAIVVNGLPAVSSGAYPYYEAQVRAGDLAAAEQHRTVWLPMMLTWLGVLGALSVGAGAALAARRPRLFAWICTAAGVIVLMPVVPALLTDFRGAGPFSFAACAPLLAIAGAGALTLRLDPRARTV